MPMPREGRQQPSETRSAPPANGFSDLAEFSIKKRIQGEISFFIVSANR